MINDQVQELLHATQRNLVNVGLALYPDLFKLKPSILHYKMSDAMVNSEEPTALALPRELGKTTYVWEIFTSWNILHRKYKYIVFIASSLEKGKKAFRNVKSAIQGHPFLRSAITIEKGGDTAERLIYSIAGQHYMITVFGQGQNLRGERFEENRPDLIILDDIESKELVRNPEQRKKLKEWFHSDVVPLGSEARIVVTGTILHDDSFLSNLLEDPPVDPRTNRPWVTHRYAVVDENGDPTWPEKYSHDWIANKRRDLIAKNLQSTWDNEYMNVAVSRESRTFDPTNVRFYGDAQLQSARRNGLDIVIVVDPGIRPEGDHDPTVIMCSGMDALGNMWILDVHREKMLKQKILDSIVDMYIKWQPRVVYVEGVQGQYYLIQDLESGNWKGGHSMNVEEVDTKQVAMGKNRIYNLEPVFKARQVMVHESAEFWVDFQVEIVSFPRGKHDDILDCMAYAKMNHYKIKRASVDPQKVLSRVSSTAL